MTTNKADFAQNIDIIDSHTHIFPEKIATKAVTNIGHFYGIGMCNSGLISDILENGKKNGIKKFVVNSSATVKEQVQAINNFILNSVKANPEFVGLISLHPDLSIKEIENQIKFAKDNDLRGVKLHPDFQKFYIDDEKAYNIYSAVEGVLPILFHTGDARFEESRPHRLAKISKKFKNLVSIGAHFGGYQCWDQIDCYLDVPNVHFDTSSSLFVLEKDKANEIIHKFGANRFMFGSDYPMWKFDEELERFNALELNNEEKIKILSLNAKKMYKID